MFNRSKVSRLIIEGRKQQPSTPLGGKGAMIRTCERCGLNYPASGKHNCSRLPPKAANENEMKVLLWRRGYMREYMRRRRARLRAAVDGGVVANQEGREA
jgi:hypothetical protein